MVGGVLHDGPTVGRYGTMYFPYGRYGASGLQVVLRATRDTDAAITDLRRALAELDPRLPLADVDTMSGRLSAAVAGPQFRARLLGIFAAVALLLAAAGLYGVLAFFVTERRRELGVRLALGADAGVLVWLVVRQGMRLVLAGLVIGLIAAAGVNPAAARSPGRHVWPGWRGRTSPADR